MKTKSTFIFKMDISRMSQTTYLEHYNKRMDLFFNVKLSEIIEMNINEIK